MRGKWVVAGLWLTVLVIGLTSVLTRSVMSGDTATLTKSLVLQILDGNVAGVRPEEVIAFLLFSSVLVLEPLAVMGAMLLLEFRFSSPAGPTSCWRDWADKRGRGHRTQGRPSTPCRPGLPHADRDHPLPAARGCSHRCPGQD